MVTRIIESGKISPGPDRQTADSADIPASVVGQFVGDSLGFDLNTESKLNHQPERLKSAEATGKGKAQSLVDESTVPSKLRATPGDVEVGESPGTKALQAGVDTESVFDARAMPKQPAPKDNAMNSSAGPLQTEDSRADEVAVVVEHQPSSVNLAADSPTATHPQTDDLSQTGSGSQVATETSPMPHQDLRPQTPAQIHTDASDDAMRKPLEATAETPAAEAVGKTRAAASAVSRTELDAKLNTFVEQARAASVQPQDDKSADLHVFAEHSSASRVTPIEPPRKPEVRIGQVDVFVEAASRPQTRPKNSQRPSPGLASRHYLRRL